MDIFKKMLKKSPIDKYKNLANNEKDDIYKMV